MRKALLAVPLGLVGVATVVWIASRPGPAERAARYLASRQRADGSWRGDKEPLLQGPALTGFVLYALPEGSIPSDARRRAESYLESRIDADGIVSSGGEGTDLPNYGTALALLALAGRPDRAEVVARMAGHLKRAQLDEEEGWRPEDREYGGWDVGGRARPKPEAFRLDLSVTRFVLEALRAAGVPKDDPVWERARRFVEGCQNLDGHADSAGGFFFTPRNPFQNKAGVLPLSATEAFQNSYGTPTADGLLCLELAGGAPERIAAARAWLDRHFTTRECPGFPAGREPRWQEGLLGYWLASMARAGTPVQRHLVRARAASLLGPDGSWSNPSPLMHENDPVLGTALLLLALRG